MKKIFILFLFIASIANAQRVQREQVDVFVIGGQSQGIPQGDSSLSPKPKAGTAYKYYNNVLAYANDPVGPTSSGTGTAWPSFAVRYYSLTGRKICFVQTAVGGSSAFQADEPNNLTWDVGGTLLTASVNQTNAALDSLRNRGFSPVLKGVLWWQGENDGTNINDASETADQYKAATRSIIYRYRASFSDSLAFYFVRTGTNTGTSDVGFAAVRQGQEDICDSMLNTSIIFRGVLDFGARGFISGVVHVDNQNGLNEIGFYSAENVVKGNEVQPFKVQYNKVGFGTSFPTALIEFGANTSTLPATRFGRNGVLTSTLRSMAFEPTNTKLYYTDSAAGVVTRRGILTTTGTDSFLNKVIWSNLSFGTDNNFSIGSSGNQAAAYWGAALRYNGNLQIRTSNASNLIQFFQNAEVARFSAAANLLLGTTTDAASSKLTIASTTQGFLPPRMTATQASAISSPAQGLMLFVTDTNGTFTAIGWWGYNGSVWEKLNN